MKKLVITIAATLFAFATNAQINYNNNTISGTYASAIGENNDANGNHSFVGGVNSETNGLRTFAFGNTAKALANNAVALGHSITSNGVASFTFGKYLTANGTDSYVIGKGNTSSSRLANDIPNSLMIGFNSTKPTFFVSQSYGLEGTGKIGIGNVTDPQAKLHIKGDANEYTPEDADLLLEPGSADNFARIKFGTTGNRIDALDYQNLNFHTASGFVFWDGNVGIGTENPQAKLQVTDGDIFIEDIDRGIIMKSPDGQCWRVTVENTGALTTSSVDCNLVTGIDTPESSAVEKVEIYPNPSYDKITIESSLSGSCRVTDINGALLFKKQLSKGKTQISLKNFASEYYIITVTDKTNRTVATEKILKR